MGSSARDKNTKWDYVSCHPRTLWWGAKTREGLQMMQMSIVLLSPPFLFFLPPLPLGNLWKGTQRAKFYLSALCVDAWWEFYESKSCGASADSKIIIVVPQVKHPAIDVVCVDMRLDCDKDTRTQMSDRWDTNSTTWFHLIPARQRSSSRLSSPRTLFRASISITIPTFTLGPWISLCLPFSYAAD